MASRPPDFEGLLARLTTVLDRRGVPFMLIGGQAVLLHGDPRLTEDVDVTLGLGPGRWRDVVDACADIGLEPLPDDVQRFVATTFVLPALDEAMGVRVDLIFSTTPYEAQAIERAIRVEVGGEQVPFVTAEDLIIHKLFAGRARDLDDAASVVRRKSPDLDWDYMRKWAEDFAQVEGREDLPARLEELRDAGLAK
jgi:predicted nucleotidyltransferase